MSDSESDPQKAEFLERLEKAGLGHIPEKLESLPALGDEPTSPRAERIALAVAMVQSNQFTGRETSEFTGVPVSVVWGHKKSIQKFEGLKEEIEDLATAITVEASHVILDALQGGEMTPHEATKAMQVARDTLAKKQHWERDGASGGQTESALTKIVEALAKKIPNQRVPGDDAIDITPPPEETTE